MVVLAAGKAALVNVPFLPPAVLALARAKAVLVALVLPIVRQGKAAGSLWEGWRMT